MGKKSQAKGRRAEIELCGILRENGIPAEPGTALNYGKEPDIKGVAGLHCECKRHERTQIWEWMEQSQRDAQRFGDGTPTVIFRRSRSRWLICMELDDFLTRYYTAETDRNQKGD